jgi:hypothetical protein
VDPSCWQSPQGGMGLPVASWGKTGSECALVSLFLPISFLFSFFVMKMVCFTKLECFLLTAISKIILEHFNKNFQ